MIKLEFRRDYIIWIVAFLLFILLFPLISQVKFMQNDDWVHYKTVENFLRNDFRLFEVIGITFYTQGFFGLLFSKIFGVMSLPFLTLIISILNFVIVATIVDKQFKVPIFTSVLLGLLVFLSPLHIYSTIGFMTENFVLFFLLLGIYFADEFIRNKRASAFVLLNLTFVLGFFIKQYLIVAFISMAIVLLSQKLYKYFFVEFLISCSLIFYYYFLFPRTSIIENQSIQFSNLFDLSKSYSLLFVAFIYLSAMLLPILFAYAVDNLKGRTYFKIVLSLISVIVLMFILKGFFLSTDYPFKDFPYIGNTFDRKGFFPGDLDGNKYWWRGVFDVMRFWDLLSLFGLSTFAISVFSKFKSKFNENINLVSMFFILYLGLFLVSWNTYDRYFLPLIATGVLILSKYIDFKNSKLINLNLIPFLLFLGFLDFQFSKDYIGWQSYVWNKSIEISGSQNIPRDKISASRAWNKYYNVSSDYLYKFSFDSPDVISNQDQLTSLEKYSNNFSWSLYINPNIYLYSSAIYFKKVF